MAETNSRKRLHDKVAVVTGTLGLYAEPGVIRTTFNIQGWNLDGLDTPAICNYLIGDLKNRLVPPGNTSK